MSADIFTLYGTRANGIYFRGKGNNDRIIFALGDVWGAQPVIVGL